MTSSKINLAWLRKYKSTHCIAKGSIISINSSYDTHFALFLGKGNALELHSDKFFDRWNKSTC